MDWKEFRNRILEKYKNSEIDSWIKNITDTINSSQNFVTLSSCSGRIAIMDMPEFGDKKNSIFLGKWHDKVPLEIILNAIRRGKMKTWFIMNPPIIHVACKNTEFAFQLLNILNQSGYRRSGIISAKRNVIEISSSERVEFLVAKNGIMIADEKVIAENIIEAVEKLEKSRTRMMRFVEKFKEVFL